MSKLYIAGPMRNVPYLGFHKFITAKDWLIIEGYEVCSPVDLDIAAGFNALDMPEDSDWSVIPAELDLKEIMKRDIAALLECDGVYMLSGWSTSVGARAEHAVSIWAKQFQMYEDKESMILTDSPSTDRSIRG